MKNEKNNIDMKKDKDINFNNNGVKKPKTVGQYFDTGLCTSLFAMSSGKQCDFSIAKCLYVICVLFSCRNS